MWLEAVWSVQLFGAVCANNGRQCLSSKGHRVALVFLSRRRSHQLPPTLASQEDVHRHLLGMGINSSAFPPHKRADNKASSKFLKISWFFVPQSETTFAS